jgi:hypothetical protein
MKILESSPEKQSQRHQHPFWTEQRHLKTFQQDQFKTLMLYKYLLEEAKPTLLAPVEVETASTEDIYFDASDKKTPSEDIPNATNAPVT